MREYIQGVISDAAEVSLPLRGMESIEGFKKSFITMVSGSISDGFDDLASSVRRASTVVGVGLAVAGMFIGAGLIGSTVLAAYLEHRYRWDDEVGSADTDDEPPTPHRRMRLINGNRNSAESSNNNRLHQLNSHSEQSTAAI
eukprot:TRINITY_DN6313_c0_g1_i4.p1 TRINITY_DN6313_c0_g1~~TRINITY_DN6313_c0_g1_i4.p1  ORF type:complete len:142 (+),score=15.18 TRINITY_DN6313_c0_g1_i4:80-505(+)